MFAAGMKKKLTRAGFGFTYERQLFMNFKVSKYPQFSFSRIHYSGDYRIKLVMNSWQLNSVI